MAAESDQSPLLDAAARWWLEHLLRRARRGKCNHQGLPGAQISRRARDRPADVACPGSGFEPGGSSAHEHLLETLPGLAGIVPLGLCSDHSLRGDSDREMVLRELQRDE